MTVVYTTTGKYETDGDRSKTGRIKFFALLFANLDAKTERAFPFSHFFLTIFSDYFSISLTNKFFLVLPLVVLMVRIC